MIINNLLYTKNRYPRTLLQKQECMVDIVWFPCSLSSRLSLYIQLFSWNWGDETEYSKPAIFRKPQSLNPFSRRWKTRDAGKKTPLKYIYSSNANFSHVPSVIKATLRAEPPLYSSSLARRGVKEALLAG
jgi:hypothetical protein